MEKVKVEWSDGMTTYYETVQEARDSIRLTEEETECDVTGKIYVMEWQEVR